MGSFCIYYEKGFFQYEIIPSVFSPHFIYYKLGVCETPQAA